MFIRNYKGKIVYIDEKKYTSERQLYLTIWKIKYNLTIAKTSDVKFILDYVDGENLFV
jgi:hypothetical protein